MVAVTCDFRVQSQCQDFCQGSQKSVKIFSKSMGVLRGGLYVVFLGALGSQLAAVSWNQRRACRSSSVAFR